MHSAKKALQPGETRGAYAVKSSDSCDQVGDRHKDLQVGQGLEQQHAIHSELVVPVGDKASHCNKQRGQPKRRSGGLSRWMQLV